MTATVAALSDRMDDSLRLFREGVDGAASQLDARLAAAREAGDAIGAGISAHGEASEALAQRIKGDVAAVQEQLELLDVSVSASSGVNGKAIEDTKGQIEAFMVETTKGNSSAHQLITHAESLLLALDAVTRELDETLPRALDRMDAHGKTTRSALAQMKPMLEASEMVAQSTLSHVNAVKATTQTKDAQMTGRAEEHTTAHQSI